MKRKAKVVWTGSLKTGSGKVTTESFALKESPYSFGTRFELKEGTNPEELIAAAHACCYSMALSAQWFNLFKRRVEPIPIIAAPIKAGENRYD